MSGSAGFHWEVNDREIYIYFSMCKEGCWTDWDYDDEDNPPFVFGKHEKDESEYFEANYYSGIEFKYINQKIKIRMTLQDLKALGIKDAINLIQALELPCEIPAILKSKPKERFYWVVERSPSYKSIFLELEDCHSGKWVNSKEQPKCEFIKLTETDEDEEDEEDSYYYLFNSGIEFNYIDERIIMSAEQLEDLDIDTVSMLLQVLNLNAT